ncbi:MAG: alkaline phosphatase D family protein [Lunatimonas sp.]|uniref:alkaline phosphatase D family protein n=1 Tax=Lunatimonas sp. TaxID=2060141 RepID=UPI00263BA5D8|nr:alkaline phosphatase D family protein [Lunatimonas sp.]MCC5936867.1 alkaline phosphatase D family protein [Lunatimonas sp.]
MKNSLVIAFLFLSLPTFAQMVGDRTHQQLSKNRSWETSLYMLNHWTPDLDLRKENELAEILHTVFSNHKEADFDRLLADQNYLSWVETHQKILLGGPVWGNVSQEGVDLWVRTSKSSMVVAAIEDHGTVRIFGPVETEAKTDLSAVLKIHGLEPGTSYPVSTMIDGEPVEFDNPLILNTLPEDEPIRIAFGTCFHRWGLGNNEQVGQILARKPHAMLLGGDIAVQDRRDQIGMHRFDYLMRDLFPAWRQLSSKVPVYATWDDHDYMDDDLSGIPEGFTAADRTSIREVFTQSWANPGYGNQDKKEGVYFKTQIGSVDVIMVDNRFFRDEETGAFLGEEQMDWLEKQLLEATGEFIILSCGTMWSDYVSNGKDSWGVWDPEGREKIFQLIEKHRIPGVLLISGDRHGARGFTIPRESGFQFYEFEPASLGGRHGPAATNTDWETQLFGFDNTYAFGEFTFDTQLSDPEVTFRLISEDGESLFSLVLKRSELTPP